MKRIASLFAATLAATLVLAACSLPGFLGGVTGTYIPLAEFCASEEFDALNAGINNGTSLPSKVFLVADEGLSDTIEDQGYAVNTWKRLCELDVLADAPEAMAVDDGTILLSFIWDDGRHYSFGFVATDYFMGQDGKLYHLRDPKEFGEIIDDLGTFLERMYLEGSQGNTDDGEGTPIPFDNRGPFNFFTWDADGDGEPERFDAEFYDNGDEAPSAFEVSCVAKDWSSAWIDRCYGLEELRAMSDEQGDYLLITYQQGDYYYHDNLAQCTLRLVGGELIIEELETN